MLTFQINRGASYYFSANITVEGCTTLTMWGPDCNQTTYALSCTLSDSYSPADNSSASGLYNQTIGNVISCKNNFDTSCHGYGEPKIYSFDVLRVSQELKIAVIDVWLNATSLNVTKNVTGINLMCFARHSAIPSETAHDYSSNINKSPLVIQFPKVGRWYITILLVNLTKGGGGSPDSDIKVCYSMESQLLECPLGKAGANCTWEIYTLQVGLLIDMCLLL